jgi:hypothetical protein
MHRSHRRARRRRAAISLFALAAGLTAGSPAGAHHGAEGAIAGRGGTTIRLFGGDTMPMGKFALGLAYTGTFYDPLSDATIERGVTENRNIHSLDSVQRVIGSGSVGLTNELTLTGILPWTYQSRFREGDTDDAGNPIVSETDHIEGLGDLRLLARFQVLSDVVHVAPIVGLRVPTGEENRHSGKGDLLEPDHQPSPGAYDPLLGIGVTVPFDGFSLYGSTLFDWTQPGKQGFVASEQVAGGIGASTTLNPGAAVAVSPVLELLYEYEGKQKLDGVRDPDTGGVTLAIAPGVTAAVGTLFSASLSVDIPVYQHLYGTQSNERAGLVAAIGTSF